MIVPDGVLFGSSKAHKELRRLLVEDHKLDAVVKLPSGVFRPYAGVSTAILLFTKTGVGGGFKMVIVRDGKEMSLKMRIGTRPGAERPKRDRID